MTCIVSVVMSVYNGERFVRDAVDSVLHQTFEDFEFIVIDDGSTDGTDAIIRSYSDQRLRVVGQANQGLTLSLGRGLSLAKGKYFARQDADDVSDPQRLERQVEFLDLNPDVLAVGTACMEIDTNGRVLKDKRIPITDRACKERMASASPIVHGSAMARTEQIRQAGGYRAQFRLGQDRDLWLRLSERGMLANLPEHLYLWRANPGSGSSRERPEQARLSDLALSLAVQRLEHGSDEYGARLAWSGGVKTVARHQFYLGLGIASHKSIVEGLRLMLAAQQLDRGDISRWLQLVFTVPVHVIRHRQRLLVSSLAKRVKRVLTRRA